MSSRRRGTTWFPRRRTTAHGFPPVVLRGPSHRHPQHPEPQEGTDKAHLLGYPQRQDRVRVPELAALPGRQGKTALPRYIESWEGYDTKGIVEKYPLQMITPHVSIRITPITTTRTCGWTTSPSTAEEGRLRLVDGPDQPQDAEARGIKHGDIVKVYNDRAQVLGVALVTERVRPGLVHSYEASAKYDPLEPGVAGSIDRGGCMNLLSPAGWWEQTRTRRGPEFLSR